MIQIITNDQLNLNNLSVVKFGATWCPPCKLMKPTIEKLSSEFPEFTFFDVDMDENPELIKKFDIKSVPTLLIMKDSEELQRVVGLTLITPLRTMLRNIGNQNE